MQQEYCFSYGRYFNEKTIIAKSLGCKFSNDKKRQSVTKIIETHYIFTKSPLKVIRLA